MKIEQGFELKALNTFAMACKASYYIEVETKEDALKLSRDEYFRTLPMMIKGGGSNLLFVGDFRGAVLHYSGQSMIVVEEDSTSVLYRIEAGKNWHELVMECAENGLWGIENLALIPGEVGASAVQNIGAYGAEASQVIEQVHSINLETGEEHTWSNADCHYAYRYSIFKEEAQQFHLIYAVDIRLSKVAKPNLDYSGLQSLSSETNLTPLMVANKVIEVRESKLPDPQELPNGGSFFMNPIVNRQTFTHLLLDNPSMPHYIISEQEYKIPAAWLIEQCGLKGYREGNVGTYPKQPLVIVNYGGAYSHEVVDFAEMIIRTVREKFGIELHPEVRFVKSGTQGSLR
ncbi:UDP-N-acetylmuramate dehydrogenase [Porphyromonas levii]|uniref:UDP-N-acetylmuramate dehydrogenase n=1 Tax=Porphyromonas levii TaxID=28114 RepID=UPI001BAAC960|nr:UDP-N-acetylmuramate dehydrogenase [Porphyromonas levii]MBR8807183.1 UDP-N-acetylenolpyruvoylglucosamine reductase [Porphyromonas levii]